MPSLNKAKLSVFLLVWGIYSCPVVQAQVETLVIAAITPTPSLKISVEKAGKGLALGRVLESMDSQLLESFNATRKFKLLAGSDLKVIIEKQGLAQSGNFDPNDKSLAQQFKLLGAKYLVVSSVDDFEDSTEKMNFNTLKQVGLKRKIRLSVVAKLFDSTTGSLLESASFKSELKDDRMDSTTLQKNAELTDALLIDAARDVSAKIATRVANVIFPVRVEWRLDKIVSC